MRLYNRNTTWKTLILTIGILLLSITKLTAADDGTFTKTIYSIGKNSLTENYDVFTEDNKKFTLKLGDVNSYKNLTFEKDQKSNYIRIYSSSMTKGDGRYSRARSGNIEIKFDNDHQKYNLGGTSYYLRYTVTNIDTIKNAEFINKLSTKNYMYVKVDVVGQDFVFKVSLKGSSKMLKAGTFI